MALLFSASVFLSALLLFLLEPMFARMLLPHLGGAPAVWNTCVAFYQLALLAGYGYAHWLATRVRPRTSVVIHVAVLAAGAAVLPVAIDPAWAPRTLEHPVPGIFALLLRALGLPFVALAASGPLIQRWFVTATSAERNAYRLYAASNAGSLLALLLYPLAIEPTLTLRWQGLGWASGYGLLCALVLACGYAAAKRHVAAPGGPQAPGPATDSDEWWLARLEWAGLAFVPSSLMLGVTSFIATDIAAVPLLWIVPLAIYLVTLILAFADWQLIPAAIAEALSRLAIIAVVILVLGGNSLLPTRYIIAAHLAAFAAIAFACHRRLALRRPRPEELTGFLLWVAAGGALGGMFNALAAPLLFVTPIEYPLTAIAACLLFPSSLPSASGRWLRSAMSTMLPAALVIILTLMVQATRNVLPDSATLRHVLAGGPALAACLLLWRTPVRMGVGLAAMFLAASFLQRNDQVTLHIDRTFFGVHRITYNGVARILMNGTTNHGSQAVDRAYRCEPLSYYGRSGPVGDVMTVLRQRGGPARVGVVGLGTASMAAHADPADQWTFFEINPAIVPLARDPAYFTYLDDCAPAARIVVGDARLSLANEADASFDLLVLDAFSSDAIPVHLLTKEALRLYFRKLGPDGAVAIHISNRYFDLAPVVAAGAATLALPSAVKRHEPTARPEPVWRELAASRWAVISRSSNDLEALAGMGWSPLLAGGFPAWTDDFSNVLRAIRR